MSFDILHNSEQPFEFKSVFAECPEQESEVMMSDESCTQIGYPLSGSAMKRNCSSPISQWGSKARSTMYFILSVLIISWMIEPLGRVSESHNNNWPSQLLTDDELHPKQTRHNDSFLTQMLRSNVLEMSLVCESVLPLMIFEWRNC